MGPASDVLDGVLDPPWEGAIFGAAQCIVYGEYGIGRAKTAEPIELPFGIMIEWDGSNESSIKWMCTFAQTSSKRGQTNVRAISGSAIVPGSATRPVPKLLWTIFNSCWSSLSGVTVRRTAWTSITLVQSQTSDVHYE